MTMTGQHVRSESARAASTRPLSRPASPPSSPFSTGAAQVNNLRSALRGLSISDPSPRAISPRAPLSPMSSTPWPAPSRNEWSPPRNPSPESSVPEFMSQRTDASATSGRASEEATGRALLDQRLGQLKGYTQRLRAARVPGSNPLENVDSAYDEFARVKDGASDAVEALAAAHKSSRAASRSRRARDGSVAETVERLEPMRIAHGSGVDGDMDILKASFSVLGLGDSLALPGPCHEDRARYNRDLGASNGPVQNDSALAAMRDWRQVLVELLQSHRTSLAAAVQAYDGAAPPQEVTQRALDDPNYRASVIQEMRTRRCLAPPNAGAVSPAYWPLYERRFQHYDTIKETIMHVDRLLTMTVTGTGERGMKAIVRDYVIAPRGDAVLEFPNTGALDAPLLRFRVSSHMLAETSPIFEAIFGGQSSHQRILDRDLRELDGQVPREPPRSVTCTDGSCVRMYSMPQLEPNKEEALTTLLYAAHMQNDKVPREVSFAQFTAIAEVCLRYQCTSPVELIVEHRWLPAWVHKATENQPDGILLISYAFGLRRLFTRVSKTAVLNIVSEEELRAKPWPGAIKEKIWAVRTAKLAQVYGTCIGAVQEYFRPPRPTYSSQQLGAELPCSDDPPRASSLLPTSSYPPSFPLPSYISLFSLTSAPRCPEGDRWCDATGLGWLLLVLNELQLVWTVINPSVLPCAQGQPPRSLAQLLNVLRSIPSPQHPAHSGSAVCDPAPAFRAAVNDIYNSISGLTLFDVDGKRHGWGLSKHRLNEPQTIQNVSLGKLNWSSLHGSSIQQEAVAPAPAPAEDTRASQQADTKYSVPGKGSETDTTAGEEQEAGRGIVDDDMQCYQPHPPLAFAPDQSLCLRIMHHAETFGDLHALALVSPAFYAAFKNNELALMRPLVGAWRRQTLSALAGGPSKPQGLLPQELARLEGLQARSEERMPQKHSPDPSPPRPVSSHQSMEDDSLAEAAQLESSYPTDWEDDYETGARDGREGQEPREMTEEEAGRILWPDQPAPSNHSTAVEYLARGKVAAAPAWGAVAREDSGDKFLAQDLSLLAEDKSLAVLGDKSLGEDLDRRKGTASA